MNFPGNLFTGAVVAVAMAASANVALAKGKPKGAKPTDPQVIIQLFAGKTSNWNRGGHAYWAPNGEYRAVTKRGNGIGTGKWYVTSKSRLCNESKWHWDEGGQVKSETGKWCFEFATDPEGTIWERNMFEDSDWYRHKTERQVKGDKQKRKYNKIKKDLGV